MGKIMETTTLSEITVMQLKNVEGYIGYVIGSTLIVFVWLINKGLGLANPECE